jgi:hypothetical protein
MKKFEILNLEKKAIARLNDQQIIAVKGGKSLSSFTGKTPTVICQGSGCTILPTEAAL